MFPSTVSQWVALGPLLYSITQRPHGDISCLMVHLSSLQKPKSWEVGIGLLPMSHTDEGEARPWAIWLLPMFFTAQSRSMDAHRCSVHSGLGRGWLEGQSPLCAQEEAWIVLQTEQPQHSALWWKAHCVTWFSAFLSCRQQKQCSIKSLHYQEWLVHRQGPEKRTSGKPMLSQSSFS